MTEGGLNDDWWGEFEIENIQHDYAFESRNQHPPHYLCFKMIVDIAFMVDDGFLFDFEIVIWP